MPHTQSAVAPSSDKFLDAERSLSLADKALCWLCQRTYALVVPGEKSKSSPYTHYYLSDLWRDAPKGVAIIHTVSALVVLFLPLLTFQFRLFHQLSEANQTRVYTSLLNSRFYLFRLLAFFFRGNALIAAFRDSSVREELLPRPLFNQPKPSKKGSSPGARSLAPLESDYVVIGSGAAGATAAVTLAEAGEQVAVLEEGGWYGTRNFTEDAYGAIRQLFRDFGTQAAKGRSVFPVMQASCVGGSTVINGALSYKLPEAVYGEWAANDVELSTELPLSEIHRFADQIAKELEISPNLELKGLPASQALDRLGWSHHAMNRNAPGCQGTGRCLQGCPSGAKLSMENSFIPRAAALGATIHPRHRVLKIRFENQKAVSVVTRDQEGQVREIRGRKGIILAAGAVHTPMILERSSYQNLHLGRHFSCHLGVGALAELAIPVRQNEGPPQGIEIDHFSKDGIKLATQLLPPEFLFARSPIHGEDLLKLYHRADYISSWTASIRSDAEGFVSFGHFGKPQIHFEPTLRDLLRVRSGIRDLGEALFEMGALRFFPGIARFSPVLESRAELSSMDIAPLDPRFYNLGVGHIFGTCRLGSNPQHSVVDTNFRPHGVQNLYVLDASVFPSNVGVNPQLIIMALARLAAHRIMGKT